jgi:plasmid maintenance system antidote protein VapI
MKIYEIQNNDSLIANVSVRVLVDLYLSERQSGKANEVIQGASALAYMLLNGIEVTLDRSEMAAVQHIINGLKKIPTIKASGDCAVLQDWLHKIEFDLSDSDPKAFQRIAHRPWAEADPALGCLALMNCAQEDLSGCFSDDKVGKNRAELTAEVFDRLAVGQFTGQNNHQYMDGGWLIYVQRHALDRYIAARKDYDHDKAFEATRVLMLMNQLWFKLRNSLSLELKSNLVTTGNVQLSSATGFAVSVVTL